MTRADADLLCAQQIELAALPAAIDLLDSIERFGNIDDDDAAEDKLRTIIAALKQAAGRLLLRVGEPAQ